MEGLLGGEDSSKILGIEAKNQYRHIVLAFRCELDAVVQIKIVHTFLEWEFHLRAGYVVLVPIDDRPNRVVTEGPAARKYSEMLHGEERFPIFTDKEGSDAAFDGCNAARCLAITR